MYIEIAKICGLCAGATKALNTARDMISQGKRVVLYKELLHNPLVMQGLVESARLTENIDDICTDEHVIIRAHGEPKSTYDYLDSKGIEYSDCICVNVKNIQRLVYDKSNDGYRVVIIGKYGKGKKPMHPEVYGLCGWCDSPILIQDEDDISKIECDSSDRYFVVCQTTFPMDKAEVLFDKIVSVVSGKGKDVSIKNTICNGQKMINESSVELAKRSDLMIVVGGKHSSNSIELYNNVSQYTKTIFIEYIDEIEDALRGIGIEHIPSDYRVGITAGASTERVVLDNLKIELMKKEKVC